MRRLLSGLTMGALAVCLAACPFPPVIAQEIGYVEDFALADDRTVALQKLIPGTEEYYYYHALHYQNTEQFQRVENLLQNWIQRHGHTERVNEIRYRQALLTYPASPQQSLDFIRQQLDLRFTHQREQPDRKPTFPTTLDPAHLDRDRLTEQALRRHRNLQGFESAAFSWLVDRPLDADRRRELLSRLQRPDYPNLVELISADLDHPGGRGFGDFTVHQQLLLSQLDELLERRPALLNQTNFVNIYLRKLHPDDDVDWRQDRQEKRAYLQRLWDFVNRLGPAHNNLKAHVLYQRLVLGRAEGIYDKPLFLTYVQLPRDVPYVPREYLQRAEHRGATVDLRADFSSVTMLPPIVDDESLVRSYLQHFFREETTYQPYEEFIRDDYLKRVFAETKIVHGLGDPEDWYDLLSPAEYQALKDRVDLDFAFTNRERFAADEPVSLEMHVKNVQNLIVNVYEINTRNYYRQHQRPINTDVQLDGLVANHEQVHTFAEPPLRRMRRNFDFPELTEPGVYVIDFIGSGKASRAIIRKGTLDYVARTSVAGQVLRVFDQQRQLVPDATVYLGGHQYKANEDGEILIPYSTDPGRKPIVLYDGHFAVLDHLEHQAEQYELKAAIHVDREALIERESADLLVRAGLFLNGRPVTLSVLEDVALTMTSTDLEGISTTKELTEFELFEDRESVHTFHVPPRLAKLQFQLRAKVRSHSRDEDVDLQVAETFSVNEIHRTEKTQDVLLRRVDSGYLLEVSGKTGEVKPDQPVQLKVKHRDFRDPVQVTLQTDQDGTVQLGPLEDVEQLTASDAAGVEHSWNLLEDRRTYRRTMHRLAGTVVEVPFMGSAEEPLEQQVSLLELRGDTFVADRLDRVSLEDGMLRIAELPAGDYDLQLKRLDQRIRLRITEAKEMDDWLLGSSRSLQALETRPLQIASLQVEDEELVIRLHHASPFTRLHLFATRVHPAFEPYGSLQAIRGPDPSWKRLATPRSLYVEGRNLGDEIRYILDRRYAETFPGNMLDRAGLLLNPWAVRDTQTEQQHAAPGEAFQPQAEQPAADAEAADKAQVAASLNEHFSSLDFLADGSAVLANLTPDADGVLRISLDAFIHQPHVHVVAVDPETTVYRTLALEDHEAPRRDLRLAESLDPDKHYAKQKQITLLEAGDSKQLDLVSSSQLEIYDSLARVYALYATLSGDPKLIEFAFVLDWPNYSIEEKRRLYSKYACHELNFFLKQKDPQFFQQEVQPYLGHKKHKTFLDRFLVEADLQPYLAPWEYEQLNVVERILLARRVAGEPERTRRHVNELFSLRPTDQTQLDFWFDTAIRGRALEVSELYDDMRLGGELHFGRGGMEGMGMGGMGFSGHSVAQPADADEGQPLPQLRERFRAPEEIERLRRSQNLEAGMEADPYGDYAYFDRDERLAEARRRLYRQIDKTQEWAENNYYQLPIEEQNAELITAGAFWNDLAGHDLQQPFLTEHIAAASGNFPEMMFALAVLDLPFSSAEHEIEIDEDRLTLTAESPAIAFHQEITEVSEVLDDMPILVSQNFFRHDDRYQMVDGQRQDKFVTDEFLIHTVYGCQVVVTNPTSSPQKLDVLLQIPQGALPVVGSKTTRSVTLELKPFHTESLEFHFYFPAAGRFPHYPVQVTKQSQLVAYAEAVTMDVVERPSRVDRESWAYVSQFGSDREVLEFLEENNLQELDLTKIAFRMQDADFFRTVIDYLSAHHAYDHTLWSYGVLHDEPAAIEQFLQHEDRFVRHCGMYIDSPLLTLDPVARRWYEHLEYEPLVNARTHALGPRRQIVNDRLHAQYHQLLNLLSYHRTLDDDQLMAVTYYMLLQERIGEAIEFFGRINPNNIETHLQYDYLAAYLAFYRSNPDLAREIADKYADHPVERWRNRFRNVMAQAREIAGAQIEVIDPESHTQQQTELASREPAFDFTVEDRRIRVDYQNIERLVINYYLMDVEMLFSHNPFVHEDAGQFGLIRPNETQEVPLPADRTRIELPLPESLHSRNVLVELNAAGKTESKAYYSNQLAVQVQRNYGQVRVGHAQSANPLPQVYVKVYARMQGGDVRFYKDGYTDLRGRFDYTSLSTDALDQVERFSLLILSAEHGAVVRETAPPQR